MGWQTSIFSVFKNYLYLKFVLSLSVYEREEDEEYWLERGGSIKVFKREKVGMKKMFMLAPPEKTKSYCSYISHKH